MKNNKIITLLLALLLSQTQAVWAQNGFNVPFSQFGIGLTDLPTNIPSAYRMGGVVYTRAQRNTVNPFNPASYSAIEMESFVFDIGLNLQSCMLKNDNDHLTDADGNLAYIMVAFPITKWWKTSMGLLPYSSVNYASTQSAISPITNSEVKTVYDGNGGVNQFYWGNGFNIGKRLSLGFNINYLNGSIMRAISYDFLGNDSTFYTNSRRQKDTYVSNLVIDMGLQYVQPLNDKYTLRLGLTCRLPREMEVEDQSMVYTYHATGNVEYMMDTIFPLAGNSGSYQSLLSQPLTVGLGLALERNELWEVALDGYYSPISGMKYEENSEISIFGNSALRYAQNYRMALGGEWKGISNASSYWQRIGISAGVYYNYGRLAVEVTSGNYLLNEVGCGLGFNLPMRKGKSALTLALGYSSFGNTELLRRNCLSIGLSIGSCERWFQKRKYN
ncbi:MAG: hypothetical protein MJZ67_01430 [Bacteroidales bacterium]|nr:hypothetical protein [Bacteroidales bacterium]